MIILSEHMRRLFAEKNFQLTEWQKATLIWNAPDKTRNERLCCLKEFSHSISDKKLIQQINERINYEEDVLLHFRENDSCFLYVVFEENDYPIGYFSKCEMAEEYAKKAMSVKATIEKQRIITSDSELSVKSYARFNPKLFNKPFDEYVDYNGGAVGKIKLNKNGEIISAWSGEMSDKEELVVDEFNPERFEFQYSEFPFEAKTGTIVKLMSAARNEYKSYGILLTDTKQWDENNLRIKTEKLCVDYSDIAVTVVYLTSKGQWSHEHINPLHLEFNVLPPFEEMTDRRAIAYNAALMALSAYFKEEDGNFFSALAIQTAQYYSEVCCEVEYEKLKTQLHRKAKKMEDIIL